MWPVHCTDHCQPISGSREYLVLCALLKLRLTEWQAQCDRKWCTSRPSHLHPQLQMRRDTWRTSTSRPSDARYLQLPILYLGQGSGPRCADSGLWFLCCCSGMRWERSRDQLFLTDGGGRIELPRLTLPRIPKGARLRGGRRESWARSSGLSSSCLSKGQKITRCMRGWGKEMGWGWSRSSLNIGGTAAQRHLPNWDMACTSGVSAVLCWLEA